MSRLAHRSSLPALVPGLLALAAASAWAGPLTITLPDGGKAQVHVVYKDGGTADFTVKDNDPVDKDKRTGHITVNLPDEDKIRSTDIKSLGVAGTSAAVTRLNFGDAGLLAFEPIDLFHLVSLDAGLILLTRMDVQAYLGGGGGLAVGAVLPVVNGSIPNIAGLELRDATSLYGSFDSFFDVFVDLDLAPIDTLPLIRGQVAVDSAIELRPPIPEPGTVALTLLALAGLAWRRRS